MFEMSRHNSKHSSRATTSRHSTNNHNTSTSDSEDDDSISGHSFGDSDDDFSLTSSFKSSEHAPAASLPVPNLPRPATVKHVHRMNSRRTNFGLNGTSHSTVSSRGRTAVIPGERKQNKLLRDRRINRQKLKEQEKDLYYHFFGTILNVSLATLAMILIVAIASTGGLCFHDDDVKVFARNQLAKCSGCTGREDNYCEICTNDGNTCYYPYNPKQ